MDHVIFWLLDYWLSIKEPKNKKMILERKFKRFLNNKVLKLGPLYDTKASRC